MKITIPIQKLARTTLVIFTLGLPVLTQAAASNWINSWMASPQPAWQKDFALPTNVPEKLENQTIRQVVRLSLGGKRMRIELSNAYGRQALRIGEVRVALAGSGSNIVTETSRAVTFNGKTTTFISPGAPLLSDPVDLPTQALAKVTVSIYVPQATPVSTFHWDGRQTAYIAAGNQVNNKQIETTVSNLSARVLLSGIHVETSQPAQAVVAIGDSITDGNGARMDANTRWPDFLAARSADKNIAVLNAGISGARLLSDGMGVNALARFDRDVLSQANIKSVIVLLGINDISWPGTAFAPRAPRPAAAELIAGYRQLIARAHSHGVRVIGATLTPFKGALQGTPLNDYFHADKEEVRQEVNAWIRSGGEFDAIVDFDAVTKDPNHPLQLKAEFDSGDHLHPGDQGHKAMADAIDINIL